MRTVLSRIAGLLHQRHGVLSRDLAQAPAAFGLGNLPERLQPDGLRTLVCGFCSVGCALDVHVRDGEVVNLTPAARYPVNQGMACPKGWEALVPLAAADRARTPYVRGADGALRAVDWDTALRSFVDRFRSIQQQHGPDALAFLSTGQITTEEMALLGCVAKFGMGIRHGDGNTRQCMATANVAYKEAFGFDAPPFTYEDLELSDVLVFIGANPAIAHPILWHRVLQNRNAPEVIVIDPRRTETAMAATRHYALQPKSDLVLLYGLARILIEHDWIDRQYIERHTTGFAEVATHVADYSLDYVSQVTGLGAGELLELARIVHEGKRVSFWWTMGINQSHEAVRSAQGIINLALMTGNIGRPGTGANSITGQANAMGSRLFSGTTCLPGGRAFENAADRAEVARILDIEVERIPADKGMAYDQIIAGIRSGTIRGLWVVATNPAHSWIASSEMQDLFRRLDCLVVQDLYVTTETARLADIVLPAAGWGEKTGTFINSERRLGLIQQVCRPPGEALTDFHIFKLVAEYWGCADLVERWKSPEAAFAILRDLSRGQPCDFSGIEGYQALHEQGGIQWPCPTGSKRTATHRRLFEDGLYYRADQKARFCVETPRSAPERPDESFPFALLSGRAGVGQWHTQTRTSKSAVLRKLSSPNAYVEIHPDDAKRLGIAPHSRVRVSSRRGAVEVVARITRSVRPGMVFMPMHYPETNRLTYAAFDPYSRQPSYKMAAVRLDLVKAPIRKRGRTATRASVG